ncbi:MAG: chorismate mutase, partial [Nitrososphaera sp.]|nr:chorismate mutase [Nitrososphaera sp.]
DARLDPAFAEKFLNFIIAEVIHHHEKIAGDSSGGTRTAGTAAARPASAPTVDAAGDSAGPAHPATSA